MIFTPRLTLRLWTPQDEAPFIAMNQDPEVMRFFPGPLSPDQSRTMIQKINRHFDQHGYSLWAVERNDTQEFIGFTGLAIPEFDTHFTPCVEIGWRLAKTHWGQGYAPEAAKAVLDLAFTKLHLEKIVSFTAKQNTPSRRVMEKIGMTHTHKDDFTHPKLPPDHPLSKHVLYRIETK